MLRWLVQDVLCDTVVRAEHAGTVEEFRCHGIVLARSDYFRAALAGGMAEAYSKVGWPSWRARGVAELTVCSGPGTHAWCGLQIIPVTGFPHKSVGLVLRHLYGTPPSRQELFDDGSVGACAPSPSPRCTRVFRRRGAQRLSQSRVPHGGQLLASTRRPTASRSAACLTSYHACLEACVLPTRR